MLSETKRKRLHMTNPTRISTLAGALALVSAAIVDQNDIDVVSATIEKLPTGAPKGSRVQLTMSGEGVDNPTRRYFLRNNSAFATLVEDAGLFMGSPKKARGVVTYSLYFGLTEELANWQPEPAAKVAKVKMTKEESAAARLAGKIAARQRRASEAAERAEAGGEVVAA